MTPRVPPSHARVSPTPSLLLPPIPLARRETDRRGNPEYAMQCTREQQQHPRHEDDDDDSITGHTSPGHSHQLALAVLNCQLR